MKVFLTNAFSLNMVAGDAMLKVSEVSPCDLPEFISAIGHESTAEIVELMINRPVEANRIAISLEKGDKAYVVTLFTNEGQPYRCPEGHLLSASELQSLQIVIRCVEVI